MKVSNYQLMIRKLSMQNSQLSTSLKDLKRRKASTSTTGGGGKQSKLSEQELRISHFAKLFGVMHEPLVPPSAEDCTLPHMFHRKLPESRNVLVWQGPNQHLYSGRSPAESTGNQHIPAESMESVRTFSAEQVHWTLAESSGIQWNIQNPVDSSRAYL